MKTLNILKYVFTLIGAGMLVGAVMSYSSTVSFIERATEATGTVIDLERSRSSDSTTYYPVVVFEDIRGREIEFRSRSGSNPPSLGTATGAVGSVDPHLRARPRSSTEVQPPLSGERGVILGHLARVCVSDSIGAAC